MSGGGGMNILPLLLAAPFAGACVCAVSGKRFAALVRPAASLAVFWLSLRAAARVCLGGAFDWEAAGLAVDGLSALLLVTVGLIGFAVSLYTHGYLAPSAREGGFSALFLLMTGGMVGTVCAADLVSLVAFLEIASLASYALVAHGGGKDALEAGFKYLAIGCLASLFPFLGAAVLRSATGAASLADAASALAAPGATPALRLAAGLLIAGFGTKAALAPFHAWLPDAHTSAPAPVSAMLSGVLVKALGVYALLRLFLAAPGPGVAGVLATLAAVSIIGGALLATAQHDYKRLLAWSSVSQVGYIVAGAATGTSLGMAGALLHLCAHSAAKSALFLSAGAVDRAAGTRDMRRLGGLRERMPVTASSSLAASLSLAGVPPLGGFWSKLLILLGCVEAGLGGLACAAALGSLLTLGAVMKAQRAIFYGELRPHWDAVREAPPSMRAPMVALAVLSAAAGLLLLPGPPRALLAGARDALRGTRQAARFAAGDAAEARAKNGVRLR